MFKVMVSYDSFFAGESDAGWWLTVAPQGNMFYGQHLFSHTKPTQRQIRKFKKYAIASIKECKARQALQAINL